MRAMCGVQLKQRKRCKDLMLILGFIEANDQLTMANSVSWYGHVLRREDGHVLRRVLNFEAEDQRKEENRPKRTQKKQVEEESVKVGL